MNTKEWSWRILYITNILMYFAGLIFGLTISEFLK